MPKESPPTRKTFIATGLVLLLVGRCLGQANWPQFRGPDGQGVSALAAPPAAFGPSNNLVWSAEIPPGHSSPVVVGNRIFLTGLHTWKLHTIALDRTTGKLLWQRPAPAKVIEKVHPFASPASPTPLADENRVIVYFGSFGLLCYDHDGKELWAKPLPTPRSTYGTSSSPTRVGETAVIVLDSNDKASKLLAVNPADGTTVWEADRPLSASGWATPALGDGTIYVRTEKHLYAFSGGK